MHGVNGKMRIKSRAGMTLIEVIVAITIFAVIAIPLSAMFSNSLKLERRALVEALATYTAQLKIEEAYGMSPGDLEEIYNDEGILDEDFGGQFELFYKYSAVLVDEYSGDDLKLYKVTVLIGNEFYVVDATLESMIFSAVSASGGP